MKRFIIFLITVILLSIGSNAFATQIWGKWAEDSIISAINCKIITQNITNDFYKPITRKDIANLIANAYINITSDSEIITCEEFTDTNDKGVNIVSSLGIMTGYGDGTFLPENFTSRQEMAKIILTYKSLIDKIPLEFTTDCSIAISDFEELSSWAKPYVSKAFSENLISGYEDNTFKGFNPVSWQEAIVMIARVAKFNPPQEFLTKEFELNIEQFENQINVSWIPLNYDLPHTITITEQRLSRYENDIPPNQPVVITTFGDNYSFECYPNKKYSIKISCLDKYSEKNIFTTKKLPEGYEAIALNYPTSEEEACALITEVKVPVWKLCGNEKVPAELPLKVHKDIAEKVVMVFEEIFNGPEKFPIKDLGGYSWRGGTSEHNGGTAIDINSNENYCIYLNGTTIGSHWKPYEDPYSITPYGDVVRAFEKYGFTWGGDSWSNPKDYMHFSYLGT